MALNPPREFTLKIHGLGTGQGLNCRIFCKQQLLQDEMLLSILQNTFTYLTSKLILYGDYIYLRANDGIQHIFFKLKDVRLEWFEIRKHLGGPLVVVYSETDLRFHKQAQFYLRRESLFMLPQSEPNSFTGNFSKRSNSSLQQQNERLDIIKNDVLILKEDSSQESTKSFEGKKEYLTKHVGTMSRNKDRSLPYVYSNNTVKSPFSVLIEKDLDNVLLSPVYLTPESLASKFNKNETKHVSETIWSHYKQTSCGKLMLVNNAVLSAEKGILKEVIGNRLSSLFGRNGNSGLPIRIFKPFTHLESIANLFCNLDFLHKAKKAESVLEKFKCVVAYAFSNMSYGISPWKPFTPYLGETLQGKTADGSEVYLEHYGHKPFLDSILIVNSQANFRVSGTIESEADESANKVIVWFKGLVTVELESVKYYFTLPAFVNEGFSYNKRTLALEEHFHFYCPENSLRAIIKLGDNGKPNVASGGIYTVEYPVKVVGRSIDKLLFRNGKLETKESTLCEISGNWFEALLFDQKVYWDNSMSAYKLLMKKDVLPSDWRFREDILWLLYEKPELAMVWKLKLEEMQREFRKKREKRMNGRKKW